MWSSKNSLILIFLLLAGCGFRPLYEPKTDRDTFSVFSTIKIFPTKDRTGQLLTNELIRLLHPKGASDRVAFQLKTTLSETETSLGVEKSAVATRGNLKMTAKYNLKPIYNGPEIKDSIKTITVSYNLFTSPFARSAAKKNARARAVREIAQEIRHHLGVVLRDKSRRDQ